MANRDGRRNAVLAGLQKDVAIAGSTGPANQGRRDMAPKQPRTVAPELPKVAAASGREDRYAHNDRDEEHRRLLGVSPPLAEKDRVYVNPRPPRGTKTNYTS